MAAASNVPLQEQLAILGQLQTTMPGTEAGNLYKAFMMKVAAASERKIDFREMYFREYSQKIRAAVDLPLAYLGGVKSMDNVEAAMGDGFDCVVLARALLRDPDLVEQFRSGGRQQSRCDNCNACVAYIYHPDGTRCVYRGENDPQANRVFASDWNPAG